MSLVCAGMVFKVLKMVVKGMLLSGMNLRHFSRAGRLSGLTSVFITSAKMKKESKRALWYMCRKYQSTSDFGNEKEIFYGYWKRLDKLIDWEKFKDPYLGLRIAQVGFKEPYLRGIDCELLTLAVMRLLMKFVYNTGFEYAKFTISYVMKIPTGEISYTIGSAIPLVDDCGKAVPKIGVYAMIEKYVRSQAEDYEKHVISGVFIRVYLAGRLEMALPLSLSSDSIGSQIWDFMEPCIGGGEPLEVKAMGKKKRRYPDHITALKPHSKEMRPFIVADLETVLNNENMNVPYAAGFLVVKPGEDVGLKAPYGSIETYFSEDFILEEEKCGVRKCCYPF